jgi:hypothetical protein
MIIISTVSRLGGSETLQPLLSLHPDVVMNEVMHFVISSLFLTSELRIKRFDLF